MSFLTAQELDVQGRAKVQNSLTLGDIKSETPEAGMIRWNEMSNDFEGFIDDQARQKAERETFFNSLLTQPNK